MHGWLCEQRHQRWHMWQVPAPTTVVADSASASIDFFSKYPVYFALEDDDINVVLANLKKNDATGQPATATTGGGISMPTKKGTSKSLQTIVVWLSSLLICIPCWIYCQDISRALFLSKHAPFIVALEKALDGLINLF